MARIEDRMMAMIELLLSEVEARRSEWGARGIDLQVRPPAADDLSDRRAVRLDAESTRAIAQMMLWESGDLDLVVGDATTGDVILDEHREVSSLLGVRDALAAIEAHLADQGT